MSDRVEYTEIADALVRRRAQLRLSQTEVADRMGKQQVVVSRHERGAQNITVKTLREYAKALDATLEFRFRPKQARKKRRSR